MVIREQDLVKWKKNSLKIARKLGYNKSLIDFLDENVILKVNTDRIPQGMWYGYAHYSKENPVVEVYSKNLSLETTENIISDFKSKGIPKKTLDTFALFHKIVPKRIFFDTYNQSGMDHELIGHILNHMDNKDAGEKAAVEVQIKFAKARSGWLVHKWPWKVISKVAPIILYHHKKDAF